MLRTELAAGALVHRGRPEPARERAAQPRRECARRHAGRRAAQHRHGERRDRRGLRRRSGHGRAVRRHRRLGHRHRHGRRDDRARLRAVLHDEGCGPGHRARPLPGLWLRAPVERACADRERAGPAAPRCASTCRAATPAARARSGARAADVPARADGETCSWWRTTRRCANTAGICLRELGYRVVEAPNGAAALALLEREPGIGLLFTDIGLPGGHERAQLAEAALAPPPRPQDPLHLGLRAARLRKRGADATCWPSPSPPPISPTKLRQLLG